MTKAQKIAARYSEYRQGITRANQHWEIIRDIESHNKAHSFNEFEEVMLSYLEWDIEMDPLCGLAYKAYRRRLNDLRYKDFMEELSDGKPEP